MPIKGELGPLSNSVEDLILFTEFFCDKNNYKNIHRFKLDPYVTHVPLDYEAIGKKQKFRIGMVKNLKRFDTSKANLRGVLETAEMLR